MLMLGTQDDSSLQNWLVKDLPALLIKAVWRMTTRSLFRHKP
jgi:hypothetical protein